MKISREKIMLDFTPEGKVNIKLAKSETEYPFKLTSASVNGSEDGRAPSVLQDDEEPKDQPGWRLTLRKILESQCY